MKLTNSAGNQKGQTLIFVLLLMTIALAVGTSISSRTISTIRRTTNTDSSSRAVAAAEAAVEFYLSQPLSALDAKSPVPGDPTNCTVSATTTDYPDQSAEQLSQKTDQVDTIAKVTIGRYGCVNNASDSFKTTIAKDNILELKLRTSGALTGNLDICFSSPTGSTNYSSLYNTLIAGTSPNYTVTKYGYNQAGVSGPSNNFRSATSSGTDSCYTINMPAASNPQLLRILSLYNSSTVTIKTSAGYRLPFQGYTISAVGIVGAQQTGTARTVIATKSLPYLPVPFNFGVYSQSTSNGL